MLLKPAIALNDVTEISASLLEKHGIKGLLLDLDNTLTTHNNPEPKPEVMAWLSEMKRSGISLMIVSNNKHARVKPFAERLGLEFESNGKKPVPVGFRRAEERMGLSRDEVAVVGDQLYTDILGANLGRYKSIFVFPMEPEKHFLFKVKRALEKPFLPKRSKL